MLSLTTCLRRSNVPVHILAAKPGRLFTWTLLLGILLALWAIVNRVGIIQARVIFALAASDDLKSTSVTRDLPLGFIQQLNYGPWYVIGLPILLAIVAMTWTSWNRACDSPNNNIPPEASLREVSKSPAMSIIGIGLTLFLVVSSIQVEIRDFPSLGLGWVQAKHIHEAKEHNTAIAGTKFNHFTEGGHFRTVVEARVESLQPAKAGMYNTYSFVMFVALAKTIYGLWQATVMYLSLLFLRVGLVIVRHMKRKRLYEKEGAVRWTVVPATLMFFAGGLTNLFSTARYVANMAKGSYGSWDQYVSFLVISPGLATSIFGAVAIYLVYFEAQGRANPWAGTTKPYWWALSTAIGFWLTTLLGVIRLLLGLDPATAEEVTEWLQKAAGVK